MWLATEGVAGIEVYYSDHPYSSFSGPILIAPTVGADDIAAVTALPNNTIGVLWSDRNAMRFGFRVHEDGTDPAVWLADEVPASQSAQDTVGAGMADDHVNLAVGSDGSLYAAVKSRYPPNSIYPHVGLLVRRPDAGGPGGTWENFHYVDNTGTRPIVVYNEENDTIRVFYSSGDAILGRESQASTIAFGPAQTVMSGGLVGFNNATSTKDRWSGRLLVLGAQLRRRDRRGDDDQPRPRRSLAGGRGRRHSASRHVELGQSRRRRRRP
jgi:hypothetical protein